MSLWIWILGSLVIGVLVGAVGMVVVRRRNDTEQRLRRLRREFDQYQGEVGSHFSQQAEVLTRLRNDFSQLYHHTERGAASLVGEEALQRRLRELESGDGRDPTPPPDRPPGAAAPSVLPPPGPPAQQGERGDLGAAQEPMEPGEDPTAQAIEADPAAEADETQKRA